MSAVSLRRFVGTAFASLALVTAAWAATLTPLAPAAIPSRPT